MIAPRQALTPSAPQPTPEEVRAHVAAMLDSRYFRGARLEKLLLQYVVERALDGDYAALDESAIAVAVFGRRPSYDPVIDGVVGLVARRLRHRLASYYASRKRRNAALRIDLPKGGFAPVFVRPGRRTKNTTLRVVLAAALVMAAAGIFWAIRSGSPARRPYNSVAVLPFRNLNELPALDHYSAGMAARLQDGLRKTAGLRVAPSMPAGDSAAAQSDVPTLARSLAVDAVVRGSVFVRDPDVRISVELVDGNSGKTLWSDVYDNPADQVTAVGNDILYALKRVLKPGR